MAKRWVIKLGSGLLTRKDGKIDRVQIGRIVDQVASIDALVTSIAASASEQATGLHEVNTAVNQMDQVVQQNAAMVEQATAADGDTTNGNQQYRSALHV